jgi:tetratricopeptide (TPR) repeat protein
LFLYSSGCSLFGQTNDPGPGKSVAPSAYAQEQFQKAHARYQKEPANSEAAWQFGRACFDLAEFADANAERARLAQQGLAACQESVARESNSAPAYYYLGMNLGQLARTKGMGALKLVNQMEREFSRARNLDEHLDHAGPDRNLGLLYRDAPTIISVGSRSKARTHLQRAVELEPDFPENRLNLIEARLKWSDRKGSLQELKALEEALPKARAEFIGPAWASSWADWDARLKTLRKKLEDAPVLESPRGKQEG